MEGAWDAVDWEGQLFEVRTGVVDVDKPVFGAGELGFGEMGFHGSACMIVGLVEVCTFFLVQEGRVSVSVHVLFVVEWKSAYRTSIWEQARERHSVISGWVWSLFSLLRVRACEDSSLMPSLVMSREYQLVEGLSFMGMWDIVE